MGTRADISLVAKPNEGRSWQAISWLPVYWPQPAGTAAMVDGLGAGRAGLGDGAAGEGGEDGGGGADGETDVEATAEADADAATDGRPLRARLRDTR
jgi:hypothetical protein